MLKNKHTPTDDQEFMTVSIHKDHDIIAIVEALRFNQATQFNFILPQNPKVFYSHFNYKLLKNITDLLQKDVVFITEDEIVIKLAKQFEFKTAPAVVKHAKTGTVVTKKVGLEGDSGGHSLNPLKSRKSKSKNSKSQGGRRIGDSNAGKSKSIVSFKLFFELVNVKLLINLGLAVVIIGGLAVIYFVIPKTATVRIQTDSRRVQANLEVDLVSSATEVNVDSEVLPLEMVPISVERDHVIEASGRVEASRASGIVEVYNCHPDESLIIDSSTIFEKDNKQFRLQADLEIVIPASVDIEDCQTSLTNANKRSLRIEAVNSGVDYNLGLGNYEIISQDSDYYQVVGFELEGGQEPSGCISDNDLKAAQEEFRQGLQQVRRDHRQLLVEKLQAQGLIPLEDTFQLAEGEINTPQLCPTIAEGSLSQVVVSYMGGVKPADLEVIVHPSLQAEVIGLEITDYGIDSGRYEVEVRNNTATLEPTIVSPADIDYYLNIFISNAQARINLDELQIKKDIVSRPANEVGSDLRRQFGIGSADVSLSPFWAVWIRNLPSDTDRITVVID